MEQNGTGADGKIFSLLKVFQFLKKILNFEKIEFLEQNIFNVLFSYSKFLLKSGLKLN